MLFRSVFSVAPDSGFRATYPNIEHWYFPGIAEPVSLAGLVLTPPEFDWYVIWHGRMTLATFRGNDKKIDVAERRREIIWNNLVKWDSDTQPDDAR